MKKEESVEKAHPNSEGREDEEEEENTIEQRNNNNNKNKENHHHHSVSPPESNSPSPSLHSLSNSPISNDHLSVVQPPFVTAHRFQVEPTVITKIDPAAEEGFVGVKGTTNGGGNRGLRPDVSSLLSKVLLGFRISAFVFCLVSFSVLAADQKKGWAQDSFFLYKEFRYSLTVNVIGFLYSGLQICDQAYYLITRKHIVEHMLRVYFTFALDQIIEPNTGQGGFKGYQTPQFRKSFTTIFQLLLALMNLPS
ncbi:uncharacterized protein [Cicer arietinum]|uniref:uncharacterized protein isoform X2 n=1 Tax=Cicer arietinum TaxID=3827 RepID=UPI003CC65988